jgi:hypothetical protein
MYKRALELLSQEAGGQSKLDRLRGRDPSKQQ